MFFKVKEKKLVKQKYILEKLNNEEHVALASRRRRNRENGRFSFYCSIYYVRHPHEQRTHRGVIILNKQINKQNKTNTQIEEK